MTPLPQSPVVRCRHRLCKLYCVEQSAEALDFIDPIATAAALKATIGC
jgi:hypothetical protein